MGELESNESGYENLRSIEPQPDRKNICEEVGEGISTPEAGNAEAPSFVTDLEIKNDKVKLKVAGVQRSFRMDAKFKLKLADSALQSENAKVKTVLEHLYKIGRYTQSEHGSIENFEKSQAAIAAYLNPEPTAEEVAREATPEPEGNLEIPAEFATTGLAEVLRETGFDGQFKIERMPGNGNRPVVILIPKSFDKNKAAKLLVHFHGTHSDKVAAKNFKAKKSDHSDTAKNRFTQFVQQAMAAKENVVFAYPISAGKARAAKDKEYDGSWMASGTSDNFDGLVADIEGKVGFSNEPNVVVSGHSAGGKPLKNIALSHAKTKADYIFLDASYGTSDNWAKAVTDGMDRGDIPKGKVTLFLQENPDVKTSAYIHTMPLKAGLEKQGATVVVDQTKHAVMIERYLLDGVRKTGVDQEPMAVAMMGSGKGTR